MSKSRTVNSIRNTMFGAISQVINTILSFIARTIFIKTLGAEYLGVNGLFTNILTILSFAELGIGNAIIFSMYKPVAEENTEKVKSLMSLYKKSYNIIGIIVAIAGLCIIPFMKFIITDVPNIKENIIFIYCLFLANTSLSYFFTYKKSIIMAHQNDYIINIYNIGFYITKTILQSIFLYVTHNFIIYLLIQIACTLLENILISTKANKEYKYLKDKNVEKISKEEKNNIFKNVKALVLYKFGSVILNGTDNILISSMVGVVSVGLVSNYTLVITAVTSVIAQMLNGFTSSIGNLNAIGTTEAKEKTFKELFLIGVWVFGFCGLGLLLFLNYFIELWIGTGYLLSYGVVIALVSHFYINGIQNAAYVYRTTMGLFRRGKYTPIVAAIINIILSIILCKFMGLAGIFFATSISRLVTTTWYDPYMIYKLEFKKSPREYYLKYIKYFIIIIINYIICKIILDFMVGFGIGNFILKLLIFTIISNIIFIMFFYKTEEYKGVCNRIQGILSKIKNRN